MKHVSFHGRGDVELRAQGDAVETREHGHRDHERARNAEGMGGLGRAVGGRAHHGPASRGMDIEHEDAEPHRFPRRPLHGIGNVVELEIEEDLTATLAHRFHGGRAEGGEELGADLEAGDLAGEGIDESHRAIDGIHVEGHDQTVLRIAGHSSPGAAARSSLP